jgi:hypothetical protein
MRSGRRRRRRRSSGVGRQPPERTRIIKEVIRTDEEEEKNMMKWNKKKNRNRNRNKARKRKMRAYQQHPKVGPLHGIWGLHSQLPIQLLTTLLDLDHFILDLFRKGEVKELQRTQKEYKQNLESERGRLKKNKRMQKKNTDKPNT